MNERRIAHPPLAPLRALVERLETDGLAPALGSSGLLAALGLATQVNDWDVTVDASVERLSSACAGMVFTTHGNSGCHADHKLGFESDSIELIARFAFFVPGGVVRIPTRVTGRWNGMPLGSPTAWAAAYALMGEFEEGPKRAQRRERADLLFAWLAGRTPEREVLAELRAAPLPAELARRLEALDPRG